MKKRGPGRYALMRLGLFEVVLQHIREGKSQTEACQLAGTSRDTFWKYLRRHPELRPQVDAAIIAGRVRGREAKATQRKWALYESQLERQLTRPNGKLRRPYPIGQAKRVCWYLCYRVDITRELTVQDIKDACAKFDLAWDRWIRQDEAFKLMRKVLQQRANWRVMHPLGNAGCQESAAQGQPDQPDQPGQLFGPPPGKSFLFGPPPDQSPGQSSQSFGPSKGDFPWD